MPVPKGNKCTDQPLSRKLTGKQTLFADYYTDSSNKKTYNNAYQSALAAGYTVNYAKVHSCHLLEDVRIKRLIGAKTAERQARMEYNQQVATDLLLHQYTKADKLNRIGDAVAAIRELDVVSGLNKTRFIDETDQQKELSESEQAEARRLANIRLKEA